MRTYEALYIISATLEDDAIQTIATDVANLITNSGGEIVRSEHWGRRKLAYEVKKQADGFFVLLRFTASPEFIAKLDLHFKLSETIIRHMIVHFDEATLRLEEEQAKRKRDELARQTARGDDDDDDRDDLAMAGGRGRDRDRDRDDDDD